MNLSASTLILASLSNILLLLLPGNNTSQLVVAENSPAHTGLRRRTGKASEDQASEGQADEGHANEFRDQGISCYGSYYSNGGTCTARDCNACRGSAADIMENTLQALCGRRPNCFVTSTSVNTPNYCVWEMSTYFDG